MKFGAISPSSWHWKVFFASIEIFWECYWVSARVFFTEFLLFFLVCACRKAQKGQKVLQRTAPLRVPISFYFVFLCAPYGTGKGGGGKRKRQLIGRDAGARERFFSNHPIKIWQRQQLQQQQQQKEPARRWQLDGSDNCFVDWQWRVVVVAPPHINSAVVSRGSFVDPSCNWVKPSKTRYYWVQSGKRLVNPLTKQCALNRNSAKLGKTRQNSVITR